VEHVAPNVWRRDVFRTAPSLRAEEVHESKEVTAVRVHGSRGQPSLEVEVIEILLDSESAAGIHD
jgi:hypothetical protein